MIFQVKLMSELKRRDHFRTKGCICVVAASKMVPVVPTSWHSCPCVICSPWAGAGWSDSLLMSRAPQTWWDVTFEMSVWEDRGFHLGHLLPPSLLGCWPWGKPAAVTEATLWRGPRDKAWQQPHKWSWKQTLCQQGLPVRVQPWLTAWLQPHEKPWARGTQLSCSWIPEPQ